MLRRTLIFFILTVSLGIRVLAQPARVAPAPIRVVSSAVIQTREIDLLHFDFQDLYFGFEGPNYAAMKGEPTAGAQLFVRAQLFRPEAVSTTRFELLDAAGRELKPLLFTKINADILDGDFAGLVDVPTVPFRVRIGGVDVTGKPYQRTYPRLFRPSKARATALRLPPGISTDQAVQLKRTAEAYEQETRKKLIDQTRLNPDGVITLPRAEVSEVTYEPLTSTAGHEIGLRIHYVVRVSHDGRYAFSPSVWPLYPDQNWRGKVELQATTVNVDSLPEGLTAAAAALHLRSGGPMTYRAGQTYRFTVDTIPNFVFQNGPEMKLCVFRGRYKSSPKLAAIWQSILMNDRPVSYGINIAWTTFKGQTNSFTAPGVFYQNFLKEGAKDCGAGGNTF